MLAIPSRMNSLPSTPSTPLTPPPLDDDFFDSPESPPFRAPAPQMLLSTPTADSLMFNATPVIDSFEIGRLYPRAPTNLYIPEEKKRGAKDAEPSSHSRAPSETPSLARSERNSIANDAVFYTSLYYNHVLAGLGFINGRRWWNRITPNIILGAIPAHSMLEDLVNNQMVCAVLSVIEPNRLYVASTEEYDKLRVRWLNLDADDFAPLDYEMLVRGVEWIEESLRDVYSIIGESLSRVSRYGVSSSLSSTDSVRSSRSRRHSVVGMGVSQWNRTPGEELTSFPDPMKYSDTGYTTFGKTVYVHCK
ncbi:hypothetical protein HDU93_009016, partial [Gonapodya sp. JEL0774]